MVVSGSIENCTGGGCRRRNGHGRRRRRDRGRSRGMARVEPGEEGGEKARDVGGLQAGEESREEV
jgi:hypothetical protein